MVKWFTNVKKRGHTDRFLMASLEAILESNPKTSLLGLMSIEKVKEECDLPRNGEIKATPLYCTLQFSFI